MNEIGQIVQVLLPERLIETEAGSERFRQDIHARLTSPHRRHLEQGLFDGIGRR